jgi:hypothetical protein
MGMSTTRPNPRSEQSRSAGVYFEGHKANLYVPVVKLLSMCGLLAFVDCDDGCVLSDLSSVPK